MKKRPVTTLFMLSSVDGKISTGNSDLLDVDSDYPAMDGVHIQQINTMRLNRQRICGR